MTYDLCGFTVLGKLTQRTCLLLTCLQGEISSSLRDADLLEMQTDVTLGTEESPHQQPGVQRRQSLVFQNIKYGPYRYQYLNL